MRAKLRPDVISRLISLFKKHDGDTRLVAAQLNVSTKTVWRYIRQWRAGQIADPPEEPMPLPPPPAAPGVPSNDAQRRLTTREMIGESDETRVERSRNYGILFEAKLAEIARLISPKTNPEPVFNREQETWQEFRDRRMQWSRWRMWAFDQLNGRDWAVLMKAEDEVRERLGETPEGEAAGKTDNELIRDIDQMRARRLAAGQLREVKHVERSA